MNPLLSLFFLLNIFHAAPAGNDLSVHISNVRSATAPIRVGLYNKAEKFPDDDGCFMTKVFVPGAVGDATTIFNGLPDGEYALAIFQDMDSNEKLNTNLFGYPKEPFGFSNNIKPVFSAPSFSKCRVWVSQWSHDVYIKLID